MQWAPGVDSAGFAALLPLAPGVYRFRDQAGRVLYIGRAVSLRGRVRSYWGDLGPLALAACRTGGPDQALGSMNLC